MSSDGDDFLDEMNPFQGKFLDKSLNLLANALTVGTVGYKDGKIDNGIMTDAAREAGRATVRGIKEVTGAAAAEEANLLAREQFEEQKIAAINERAQATFQMGQDQVRQSQLAGAARGKKTQNQLGDTERDFLGL